MLEKKKFLQKLKKNHLETYNKYRLEYIKNLFPLEEFQCLYLKNRQSIEWASDYIHKIIHRKKDLLFDAQDISSSALEALHDDELFSKHYSSLDEFLLNEEAKADYLKLLSMEDLSPAVQMKYAEYCPMYFLNSNDPLPYDLITAVYKNLADYMIPKNMECFRKFSEDELLHLLEINPFSLNSIPEERMTDKLVWKYLTLMIQEKRDEYIDQHVHIPERFRTKSFYESYCIVNGYNYLLIPEEKFTAYVSEPLIQTSICIQQSFIGFYHIAHTLSIRKYPVSEDIWLQLCYHHFACIDFIPEGFKTEEFFDKLLAMPGFHFNIAEPEMNDKQLALCIEKGNYIDPDKIKKARKIFSPILLNAIAENCPSPLKIIPPKMVTQDLIKKGLKNHKHYLSDIPKEYLTEELCVYAYICHPFRTMESVPDDFKTPYFYQEITKHSGFYPKDIPDEYLTDTLIKQYVKGPICTSINEIPDRWKNDKNILKIFSDYHPDRYIYPDMEHCEKACKAAAAESIFCLRYTLSKCEIQPECYVWDVIRASYTGIFVIKEPTKKMWEESIHLFPQNILEAPEWYFIDDLTDTHANEDNDSAKRIMEEKMTKLSDQCTLDDQLSIFDIFPDL